jgi:hypothetical protein
MVVCPECDMISPLQGEGDVILGLGLREETFRQEILGEEDDADPFETNNRDIDHDWSYHLNFSKQRK